MKALTAELKSLLALVILAALAVVAVIAYLKYQANQAAAALPSVESVARGVKDIARGSPSALKSWLMGEDESGYKSPEQYRIDSANALAARRAKVGG